MKTWLCSVALFIVSGCGASASPGAPGAPTAGAANADPNTGGGGTAGAPRDTCPVPFDELSAGCLPTFDGTAAQLPCSTEPAPSDFSISTCDDLVSYGLGYGFTGRICVYDRTSQQLVGVREESDTTSFCNNTRFSQTAGRFPSLSCDSQLASCPSVGAAGAAGDDTPPR